MSNFELVKCFQSLLLLDHLSISFVHLTFKFVFPESKRIEHGRFARSRIANGHNDVRVFDLLQTLDSFLDGLNKEHERLWLLY